MSQFDQHFTRRDFHRFLGVGGATLAASGIGGSAMAAADHPNVLFIASDDLNDWIEGIGGHPNVHTPNVNRLAARGVLFRRAYCAAPVCNPSRTALMTGLRPSTSGVYGNSQPWRPALPEVVTLPRHFRANGYEAAGGGKMFHGRFEEPESWDEWWGVPRGARPPKTPVSTLDYSRIRNNFDFGPIDAADEDMRDYKIGQQAIDYLNKKHERPFFLGCGFKLPHLPWYAPRKYFDRYPLGEVVLPIVNERDLDDVPAIPRRWAQPKADHASITETDNWPKAVQAYLACITFVDFCLGRVLDALDASPYAGNTIVVLWGDHGWHLGEKLTWRKGKLWEESNRTPMMVAAPGVTKPGGECMAPVSLLDLYPTLVDICGISQNPKLEGVSVRPLLEDPNAEWDRPAVMTYQRNNHSVRSRRWRYTRYSDGGEELYDHEFDPQEWKNLAGNPRFDDVKTKLAKWLPRVNAPDAPSVEARR
ncbi:MAG: sulfatase [bacterium]|nr:sulfatase [bacterium]